MAKLGRGSISRIMFSVLFAVPFTGVGVVMGFFLARQIVRSSAAGRWETVPAIIEEAELDRSSGSDSTTYRATARYAYTYEGKNHHGDRVSFYGGYDNIGTFHHDVHDELSRHKKAGAPFPCRVNPADPAQSVLYPGIRWGMTVLQLVFVLVFGGVGVGVLIGASVVGKKKQARAAARDAAPDEPWRWKPEWQGGVIRSSSKTAMLVMAGFAAFWNVISWPAAVMAMREAYFQQGEKGALLVLLFPLAGIGVAAGALYLFLRWRKFGQCTFTMASMPGVLGGRLAGAVRVPVHVTPQEGGFQVAVRCVNRVVTGSGKHRHVHEYVRWEDEQTISRELLERDPTQTAIPILFALPFDATPSSTTSSNNEIIWRLTVSAKLPGIDLNLTFVIPVFKTEASSPDFVLDESAIAPYREETDTRDVLAGDRIRSGELASGGVFFSLPPARHPGVAALATVFWVIWTGFIVAMLTFGAPILFPVIFGLFDLLILWGVLVSWFDSRTIKVERGMVALSGGLLGIGPVRYIRADDVSDVDSKVSTQSGNTSYYKVRIRTVSGKTYTAALQVRGRRIVDTLVAGIRQAIAQ